MDDDEKDFRPLPGLTGKVYVPRARRDRKHPCAECFECQWCADSRCAACRGWCDHCRTTPGQGAKGSEGE